MRVITLKNLPRPSEEIIQFVKNTVSENQTTENFAMYNKNVADVYKGTSENIAFGNFVKQMQPLNEMGKNLYQEYFSVPVEFSITYMTAPSSNTDIFYSMPPHSHKLRTLAINYYLELGGNDVKTCFYKQKIKNLQPVEKYCNLYLRDDVTPYKHFIAEKDKWYSFPTWVAHSIEQITSQRILLAIELPALYDMADLLQESKLHFETVTLQD